MPLNESEKAAVRYHLGYPQVKMTVEISLGVPDATQPLFVVESAMDNILKAAEPRVRRAIQECDCIEDQLNKFRPALEVSRTGGGVQMRGPNAFRELEEQYVSWVSALSDAIGAPINPLSQRLRRLGAGHGSVIEPN